MGGRAFIVTQSIKKLSNTLKKAVVGYTLDESKIAEEEKYDGYYAVATLDALTL